MHDREVQTFDNTGHVEVMHGHHCVALVAIDHTTGPAGGFVLVPDEARRLARILTQQADAAEAADQ